LYYRQLRADPPTSNVGALPEWRSTGALRNGSGTRAPRARDRHAHAHDKPARPEAADQRHKRSHPRGRNPATHQTTTAAANPELALRMYKVPVQSATQ
tara:strand:+ start:216 stop:509 length:294 start_codon:yes stop_codon:yes gene_type:complete